MDCNVNRAGVPLHLADGSVMALTCGAPNIRLSSEKLESFLTHQLVMLVRDLENRDV